ncbi:MAG: TFIIB-type zinc ribbon-containing protein [Sulfolobaceae archaeon]|jgi:transcription initiation factor TFIIIB Brf1 subunit/transcription initiation factor TFIIB
MECPYCKSKNLVWDYKNGVIVCSSCGLVVDQIFDQSVYNDYNDEIENISSSKYITPQEIFLNKSLNFVSKTNKILDINIKVNRVKKSRKNFEEKLIFYNGSIIRESSLIPLKYIENNEKLFIVYDFIDRIPKFRDKHIKYKVALALYFYDTELFNKIEPMLGISKKYFRKILSTVKSKERVTIRSKIEELFSKTEQSMISERLTNQ